MAKSDVPSASVEYEAEQEEVVPSKENTVAHSRNNDESVFTARVPTELVPLPSKGKVYPVGHPLHNVGVVELRHMTARDEDILTTRSFIRRGNVVDVLIKNCLLNKSIIVEDLLVGDRNALMVTLRITGFTAQYHARITHPTSNEEFDHVFNLDGLEVKELNIDPVIDGCNIFEYTLPASGIKVHFALITGKDEDAINKQVEKNRKASSGAGIDSLVTTRLKRQILKLIDPNGNESEDPGIISQFVDNMSAIDSKAFRDYVEDIEPDVDMVQDVTCPVTGEIAEVQIPIGIEFFWPRRK